MIPYITGLEREAPPETSWGFFHIHYLIDQFRKGIDENNLKKVLGSAIYRENELLHAYLAFEMHERKLDFPPLTLNPLHSGAVPLFEKGYFPWKGLPYPREHAELGKICFLLGLEELLKGISQWQHRFAVDHKDLPLFSLFSQERSYTYASLAEATFQLFETQKPCEANSGYHFDEELGLAVLRKDDRTLLGSASGCKSGMGLFLYRDCGVLNFGPQNTPIGNCQGFGLAGRPKSLAITETGIRFTTHVAEKNARRTGLDWLHDSGYSKTWIESEITLKTEKLEVHNRLIGTKCVHDTLFVFFAKGHSCVIANSHLLKPRSLDRYQGPPQRLLISGMEGQLSLIAEGCKEMIVVPLAGDDAFWGADFLIAFSIDLSQFSFSVDVT